jgi:hypothetical protein
MKRHSMPTPRSGREWLVGIGLAVGLILAAGGSARADDTTSPKFFKICNGTTPDGKTMVPHALCAVASCFVFNGLAYCKCDVAQGDSISLPFEFDDGQDICTVNAEGVGNGYMASTFSFPPSVREGQSFPGFDQPLGKNEIICSCPTASPAQARLGYQIPGPFPCQKSFFQNCKSKTANTNTGSTIYSGAPIGSARFLTHQLYGVDPPINQCPSPHD